MSIRSGNILSLVTDIIVGRSITGLFIPVRSMRIDNDSSILHGLRASS